MSGAVLIEISDSLATVTLSHPGKFNAMSRAMWRELRAAFEAIQQRRDVHCVLVRGDGGHFCAGGDISEYAGFRFEQASLRDFHENDVWGGLQAMQGCDVPIVAQIEGNCMGAGVEIFQLLRHPAGRRQRPLWRADCPARLSDGAARGGAGDARRGRVDGARNTLSAAVLDAAEMKQRGFLNQVLAADALDAAVQERIHRHPATGAAGRAPE